MAVSKYVHRQRRRRGFWGMLFNPVTLRTAFYVVRIIDWIFKMIRFVVEVLSNGG